MSSLSVTQRFGWAWMGLSLALGVHVIDEAAHDFLSVYNPNALRIREQFAIPVPVFTFEIWIAALTAAVLALLWLSNYAFLGSRWMRPAAAVFAALMFMNGLGHFAGSLYMGRWMPGVYSSPLLIAGAIALAVALLPAGKEKDRQASLSAGL
jgi:hypothetical protein